MMKLETERLPGPVARRYLAQLSRRSLLKVGASALGGLALTVALPSLSEAAGEESAPALNAFVRIEPDGRVRLTIPSVEMGQGIYTAMSMLLAEELEVGLDAVTVEHAPPNDALYANPIPILRQQTTGASASIRGFWRPLRLAGAAARLMLVAAAAKQWNVAASACSVKSGVVFDPSGTKSLPYRDLLRSVAAEKAAGAGSDQAQVARTVQVDRKVLKADRGLRQGLRSNPVRHRCHVARHESCRARDFAGVGRSAQRREQGCRARDEGCTPGRHDRPGGGHCCRPHGCGEERPGGCCDRMGRRPQCVRRQQDAGRAAQAGVRKSGRRGAQ